MSRCQHDRRGQALLLVLGVLLLILPIAAAVSRRAVHLKFSRAITNDAAVVEDLRVAAERRIHEWLAQESSFIVLPPDIDVPRVNVAHHSWTFRDQPYEFRIIALDQRGLVPFQAVHTSSPLRLFVPESVARVVDGVDIAPDSILGLDVMAHEAPSRSVFPLCDGTADDVLRVGEYVATHNGDADSAGALNVNTAPISVIERIMLLQGRGGLELVIAARTAGELATVPSAQGDDPALSPLPALIAQSDTWSFRIDLRAGLARRSWWLVCQSGGSGNWMCVQWIPIDG
jgi:hypothetical protein